MDLSLRTPPVLQGDEKSQLLQVRSYLYQMHQELNLAFEGIDKEAIAKAAMESVVGGKELPDNAGNTLMSAYSALRSIIVKTADMVNSRVDQLETTLTSDYVAASEFGELKESLTNTITATAQGVVQQFDFQSQIDSLVKANIDSEQYIKTGLIYFDDNALPRYGIAIGENLTTVTDESGNVIIERTNLAQTFTSDRQSFWQNGVEIAYYANNRLYIKDVTALNSISIGDWLIDVENGFTIS